MTSPLATALVYFARGHGHISFVARDGDINTPLVFYEVKVVTKANEDSAPTIEFRLDFGELQSLRAMIDGLIGLR
jgi:hypothetical protein